MVILIMLISTKQDNVTRLVNPEAISYAEYRKVPGAQQHDELILCFGNGEPISLRGSTAGLVMQMIEPYVSTPRPEVG